MESKHGNGNGIEMTKNAENGIWESLSSSSVAAGAWKMAAVCSLGSQAAGHVGPGLTGYNDKD